MNKVLFAIFLLFSGYASNSQTRMAATPICRVDKKSKELFVLPDPKTEFRIYGYEYPKPDSRKMICFSSRAEDVRGNYAKCPLGSYFDSNRLPVGDKIKWVANSGNYARMIYTSSKAKRTIFYLPKNSIALK
jgi:hypothetical protein